MRVHLHFTFILDICVQLYSFAPIFTRTRALTPASSLRFLFDGHILHEAQTPAEMQMEDDDLIDAFLHQVGGGD